MNRSRISMIIITIFIIFNLDSLPRSHAYNVPKFHFPNPLKEWKNRFFSSSSLSSTFPSNHWRTILTSAMILTAPFQPFSSSFQTLSPLPVSAELPAIITAENQIINLFQQNIPSVVYINTFVEQIDYFSLNVMEVPAGTGSGFVWDNQGHIVTNYHVIRNAKSARVTVTNSEGKSLTYKAKVVGVDPDKDVAVLSVITKKKNQLLKWKPIQIGSSDNLKVGQFAIAIGNPFGLDHTLTTGVVSGLGREVKSPNNKPISNIIQTDAAINPGNSGGPLLDAQGRLIGMNTAIYSPSGSSAGIGFAIPVDTLKYEVNTLIRDGKVIRPAIGVSYLSSSQSQLLGINKGILILDVNENSFAKSAGLRGTIKKSNGEIVLGDIIVSVDNDVINNESDLFKAIEKHKVDDEVTVKVIRNADLDQYSELEEGEEDADDEEDGGSGSLFQSIDEDTASNRPLVGNRNKRNNNNNNYGNRKSEEARNQLLSFKVKLMAIEPSGNT